MDERFGLRLRIAAFFAALALGGTGALVASLWFGWHRAGGPVEGYVIAGLLGGFALTGLCAWVGFLFDENVSRPILGLSGALTARAATDVSAPVDLDAGRYLGALAPSVEAIHQSLATARRDRDRAIAHETARLSRDRAILAALVQDLAQGVLVVSPDLRILLYNEAAAAMLGPLGVDRPLARFLATDALAARLDAGAGAFVSVAARDDALLTGHITALETEGEGAIGHLILLDADRAALTDQARGDRVMRGLIEAIRRPTMNIGALLDVAEAPDLGSELGADLGADLPARLRAEVETLAGALFEATDALPDPQLTWPRAPISAGALISDADAAGAEVPLLADHHFLALLMAGLEALCGADGARRTAPWQLAPNGDRVGFTLAWEGRSLPQDALDAFLAAPLTAPYHHHATRDILAAHGGDVLLGGARSLCLDLPRAPEALPGLPPPRGGFDFARHTRAARAADAPLRDLSFVIFDTETTGLDPTSDDVVQIAGVRLLRGAVQTDTFETLVDPGRPIPPGSTAIHGITDAMVAGAPDLGRAGQSFAAYAEDAILVAHNAAFDRAFLDRIPGTNADFADRPILCTARLAQALEPQLNDHTLDTVAARFGVTIPDEARHTALGDAVATAQVFKKMLPIFETRAVRRLEDLLALTEAR